ncbi:MAG: hypothetical protein NT099_04005 [Candidatus Saganbacteria bacterium]|nr:hypothetical protein [Candidatus Saganbacteria bacterium]
MNVMTVGFRGVINSESMMRFVLIVSGYFESETTESNTKADMFVGKPGTKKPYLEDSGRTMILPVDVGLPKVYACRNETGGLTFMLAEEY